jgi:hypothetical protein
VKRESAMGIASRLDVIVLVLANRFTSPGVAFYRWKIFMQA